MCENFIKEMFWKKTVGVGWRPSVMISPKILRLFCRVVRNWCLHQLIVCLIRKKSYTRIKTTAERMLLLHSKPKNTIFFPLFLEKTICRKTVQALRRASLPHPPSTRTSFQEARVGLWFSETSGRLGALRSLRQKERRDPRRRQRLSQASLCPRPLSRFYRLPPASASKASVCSSFVSTSQQNLTWAVARGSRSTYLPSRWQKPRYLRWWERLSAHKCEFWRRKNEKQITRRRGRRCEWESCPKKKRVKWERKKHSETLGSKDKLTLASSGT